jgi:hypothetical protein
MDENDWGRLAYGSSPVPDCQQTGWAAPTCFHCIHGSENEDCFVSLAMTLFDI